MEQGRSFERSAGYAAVAVGIIGFLYSMSFVIELVQALQWPLLLLGGVLSIHALAAVYRRVRDVDPGYALVGFLFGFSGALGAAVHGGWQLAIILQRPATPLGDLPNPVDPRGLLTFGFAGIGLLVLSRLIRRGAAFPGGLGQLGYLSGALLLLIYLARLIVFDISSPILALPAALEGFVVNPLWYVWLGMTLLRGGRT
jgi:hypothetical protein